MQEYEYLGSLASGTELQLIHSSQHIWPSTYLYRCHIYRCQVICWKKKKTVQADIIFLAPLIDLWLQQLLSDQNLFFFTLFFLQRSKIWPDICRQWSRLCSMNISVALTSGVWCTQTWNRLARNYVKILSCKTQGHVIWLLERVSKGIQTFHTFHF